ncbi:MAG TPA: ABC transporter permease [Vicinamibacterales bacterium]|nr:ABC transporter permease [Vicinamibacterales bacterium]
MRSLGELRRRLVVLLRRDQFDRELQEEMDHHIAMRAQTHIGDGAAPMAARQNARREFGNSLLLRERSRDAWGLTTVDALLQDLAYGWRQLGHQPALTAMAVLTLGVGIGATTAIFGIVNAVLLRPLPFDAPDRLVRVVSSNLQGIGDKASYPDFADWKSRNHVFTAMAAFHTDRFTLTGTPGGEPLHASCAIVSADLFSLLGVRAALGRTFLPDEDRLTGSTGGFVAILSHQLWLDRFGSDQNVLGRTLDVDGRPFTIVGVMPAGFRFPEEAASVDFWIPAAIDFVRRPGTPSMAEERRNHYVTVIARLRPRTHVLDAQSDLATIVRGLNREHPDIAPRIVHVVPELDGVAGDARPPLLMVFAAVGCVLLIACANVANLLLARGAARQREMAVRGALGAGRARLVRQLLVEGLLLAGLSGVVGAVTLFGTFGSIVAFVPAAVPRLADAHVDATMLLFVVTLSALTGVVFGLAPAFQVSHVDMTGALKEGGRALSTGAHHSRLRRTLVIADVAIAAALLVGAGLLIQSLWSLEHVDPGLRPDDVLTFKVDLPYVRYPGAPAQPRFFEALMQRLRNVPGVRTASAVLPLPMDGNIGTGFDIEGHPMAAAQRPLTRYSWIEPEYFRTLRIPLLQGRDFTLRDTLESTPVVIVNETFARQFLSDGRILGLRIAPGIGNGYPLPPMREIVGMVGDVKTQGPMKSVEPLVYVPLAQSPLGSMTVVVQTALDSSAILPAVRQAVASLDRALPIYDVKLLDEYVGASKAVSRFVGVVFGLFAALALILAAVGLYGVISYAVTQRTHEIGIRMALGARTAEVIGLVVGEGLKLTMIGVCLGLLAALAFARTLSGFLYGVAPTDVLTLVLVGPLLLIVAILASYVPAHRAVNLDPTVALRAE